MGGDWYDVIELPNGRLGVSVGDVVGRGLHAAAAMGQLRSALRSVALDCRGPAATLEGLDRFAASSPGTELATVVYGELDPASGEFCYACAGHPPPVIHIDGRTEVLDAGRSPLLAAGFLGPRNESLRVLAPGTTIVMYTDGLVERRGEPFDDGIQRLRDALEAAGDVDLDVLSDILARKLLEGTDARRRGVPLPAGGRAGLRVLLRPAGGPGGPGDLRRGLRDQLTAQAVDPAEVESVVLAVNEAAANAIEHGYRDGATAGVEVRARLEDESLVVVVRDRGTWRDGPIDPTRGRGLEMMRMLMDAVDVQAGMTGTTVTLRRHVRHVAATS